jgi:hypothetical protein
MRARLIAATVAVTLVLALASPAVASAQASGLGSHDDSRVPVQLVVLGAALLLVLGVGTFAYFLRKKLGLAAPPSADDASSQH